MLAGMAIRQKGEEVAPTTLLHHADTRINDVQVRVYDIPTDYPEADGTLAWNATTLIIVTLRCGGYEGMGYTYAHRAAAAIIATPLRECLIGASPMDIPRLWMDMNRSLRNIGRPGAGLMALSAVDHALWDLKARMLGVSVIHLLGRARESIPLYGSGGFTTYDIPQLQRQLGRFVEQGLTRVKMKVGTHPKEDPRRVGAAREAIGNDIELMVDANGAYTREQAVALAGEFSQHRVAWFEEPVSSDDLKGLRWIRDHVPGGMQVAAGEYGWDTDYFRRMLAHGAVDVLQIDSTRCGGFTGFMKAASLAAAHHIPVSAHCSPHLHAHVCSSIEQLDHVEFFHDHTRIEAMFFDGLPALAHGALTVDASRPGLGMTLKQQDVDHYLIAA
jgi:L-alanine-DL-glutamate epimerase-like enolase superfamily enzyme